MNILLINPPCGPRTFGMRYISRIEPLGLETIGAAVSGEHDVRLVDMLVRATDLVDTLKHFTPDVVGVTSEAVRSGQVLNVLEAVRQFAPHCLSVVGGQHATLYPTDFDSPFVDLIVQGEGVEAFREICSTRAAGGDSFDHIAGLRIRTPDGLKATVPRPLPTTLDDQPMPDRSLTAAYRKYYYYISEPHAAGVRTSFGCPFNCSFCPSRLYCEGKFVMRDPQLLFEDIRSVKEPFIYFCDSGSFHDTNRMRQLAEMLLEAGVKKRYLSYVRADNVVKNPGLFELWARAGLSIAMIGLEAIDENALRRYNKGTSTSINEQALRFLESIGVAVTGGFVVEPNAKAEDFDRIDAFIRDHPSIIHAEFTPLTPFPGTTYYKQQKVNLVSSDWEVYDMQHFVVRTELPTKELYRLMLRSYRKIVFRVMRREHLWIPLWGIRQRKVRLIHGLLANSAALGAAYLHAPPEEAEDENEKLRTHPVTPLTSDRTKEPGPKTTATSG